MPAILAPHLRDALVAKFRQQVYDRCGQIDFPHQANWRASTEGFVVSDTVVPEQELASLPPGTRTYQVQYCDPNQAPSIDRLITEHRLAYPRTQIAHHASMLASYKSGKSHDMGFWATGFACIPNALVQLIGIEYKTAEQEFNYIVEALLSSKGMRLKKRHLYFDVRNGRLHLELTNGMTYDVKSWERKDSLKGHQATALLYCEAYQLPGLETFTSISQNLRAERGFAVWGTTCDSPWLGELHDMGHGRDPDWHCTCGAPGWVNPHTFDLTALLRDCPDVRLLEPHYRTYPWLQAIRQDDLRGLMTRERFAIAWLGQLGTYAGRVYNYTRGTGLFTPDSHPSIWRESLWDDASV